MGRHLGPWAILKQVFSTKYKCIQPQDAFMVVWNAFDQIGFVAQTLVRPNASLTRM